MSTDVLSEPFLKYRVKKSTRVDYADTLEIILESDYTEEEKYFFVRFEEVDRKTKKFHSNVWGLKATRLWIKGKEVYIEESDRRDLTDTIFCPYKENCKGTCKHDLGLARHWVVSRDDPFYDEKRAKNASIQGIVERLDKKRNDGLKPNHDEVYILGEMENMSIVELKLEQKKYRLNKSIFEKFLEKKLSFEFEYCPQITKEDTLRIVNDYPEEILLSDEMVTYLKRETHYYGMTRSSIERMEAGETEQTEKDEWEYEKKQAELIGEEVEKRFRKVISEFFEKK